MFKPFEAAGVMSTHPWKEIIWRQIYQLVQKHSFLPNRRNCIVSDHQDALPNHGNA
jgi:hypothetical protein